jgi:hypothetical protein
VCLCAVCVEAWVIAVAVIVPVVVLTAVGILIFCLCRRTSRSVYCIINNLENHLSVCADTLTELCRSKHDAILWCSVLGSSLHGIPQTENPLLVLPIEREFVTFGVKIRKNSISTGNVVRFLGVFLNIYGSFTVNVKSNMNTQ